MQHLSDSQATEVHQIAQTTILAMFMRGFCVEAVNANDAVKRIVLAYNPASLRDSDDLQLSFIGANDELIAGFEI